MTVAPQNYFQGMKFRKSSLAKRRCRKQPVVELLGDRGALLNFDLRGWRELIDRSVR